MTACMQCTVECDCLVVKVAGGLVACLEWTTFASTHSQGAHWKNSFAGAPSWVKRVMAQGQCRLAHHPLSSA